MVKFDRIIDHFDDSFQFEFELDTRQIQKKIIGMCGGNITPTYFNLMKTDLEELSHLFDVFNEYQEDVENYIKSKNPKDG